MRMRIHNEKQDYMISVYLTSSLTYSYQQKYIFLSRIHVCVNMVLQKGILSSKQSLKHFENHYFSFSRISLIYLQT